MDQKTTPFSRRFQVYYLHMTLLDIQGICRLFTTVSVALTDVIQIPSSQNFRRILIFNLQVSKPSEDLLQEDQVSRPSEDLPDISDLEERLGYPIATAHTVHSTRPLIVLAYFQFFDAICGKLPRHTGVHSRSDTILTDGRDSISCFPPPPSPPTLTPTSRVSSLSVALLANIEYSRFLCLLSYLLSGPFGSMSASLTLVLVYLPHVLQNLGLDDDSGTSSNCCVSIDSFSSSFLVLDDCGTLWSLEGPCDVIWFPGALEHGMSWNFFPISYLCAPSHVKPYGLATAWTGRKEVYTGTIPLRNSQARTTSRVNCTLRIPSLFTT
ncbi:hypothetical protein C8R45DRAFT_943209 [Mycena sanguinolenta]|nr:hypothetical protein C8R45DRAFT_943209 [Mycena sanguinolenta]